MSSIAASFNLGKIDALEKVAAGMTMDQARRYVYHKDKENRQDALYAGVGGIGLGAAEGLGDALPISGKVAILPGAAAGYGVSKLKNIFKQPKELYVRNGELTGRAYGAGLGAVGGAGLGAGLGALGGSFLDSAGIGAGLGGLFGALVGSGVGQDLGDQATEIDNARIIQKARNERARVMHRMTQRQ